MSKNTTESFSSSAENDTPTPKPDDELTNAVWHGMTAAITASINSDEIDTTAVTEQKFNEIMQAIQADRTRQLESLLAALPEKSNYIGDDKASQALAGGFNEAIEQVEAIIKQKMEER